MYIHESNVCTLITYETRSIYGPNCPLLQNRKSSEKFKCAGWNSNVKHNLAHICLFLHYGVPMLLAEIFYLLSFTRTECKMSVLIWLKKKYTFFVTLHHGVFFALMDLRFTAIKIQFKQCTYLALYTWPEWNMFAIQGDWNVTLTWKE